MRITCPNCQAQYDVEPSMIPEAGRDVQCSSCAHTWFVTRMGDAPEEPVADEPLPEEVEAEAAAASDADSDDGAEETWTDMEPEAEADAPSETDDAAEDVTEDGSEDIAAEAAEPETADDAADEAPVEDGDETGDSDDADDGHGEGKDEDKLRTAIERPREDTSEPEADTSEDFRTSMRDAVTEHSDQEAPAQDGETDTAEPASEPEPETKTALDDEVADILREEAAFEARRRDEEAPPALEPQGDLALDEGAPSDVLRERLERMRGDAVPEPMVAAAVATAAAQGEPDLEPSPSGPRRERLPDIEQINSSLRPKGKVGDDVPMSAAELTATRRSGFRTGFVAVVALVAIAIGAYIFAPQIISAVPASETAMISYVDMANAARDTIDAMMARAISGLDNLTGSNGA